MAHPGHRILRRIPPPVLLKEFALPQPMCTAARQQDSVTDRMVRGAGFPSGCPHGQHARESSPSPTPQGVRRAQASQAGAPPRRKASCPLTAPAVASSVSSAGQLLAADHSQPPLDHHETPVYSELSGRFVPLSHCCQWDAAPELVPQP